MRHACGLAIGAGLVLAVWAGCERPGSWATTTPTPAATATQANDLSSILVALVPTRAGTSELDIEDGGPAIDACEAAGWPERLADDAARRVAVGGVGSPASVVGPDGVWSTTIAAIWCTAAGDIEGPIATLELAEAAPAGPPDPRVDPELRDRVPGRPHLGLVGAAAAPTARLAEPKPIPVAGNPQLHAAIVRWLEGVATKRRAGCVADDMVEGLPTEEATARGMSTAANDAVVHALRDEGALAHFVVVFDPTVVFACYGQPEFVAAVFDADGRVALELESNNGIDLQWITDLDGDGIDEALVEMHWMEDGMHDIGLLHGSGDDWSLAVLWSADTP